jgi:glutaredoxin
MQYLAALMEHAVTQESPEASVIKAYWQPGCTSCLRMKEFLTRHGVTFVSVNVLEDKNAFAELAALGIRSVPIVRRGEDWANGQVLREVARVAGVAWGRAEVLPAAELSARLIEIQTMAQRLFAQIPDDKLANMLPHRPRNYSQLAYHIFNIADAFLEHEVQCLPLEEGAYDRVAPAEMNTKAKILAYGQDVLRRFQLWWDGSGQTTVFFTQSSSLLRGRDAARASGAYYVALWPARAPAPDGTRHAGH